MISVSGGLEKSSTEDLIMKEDTELFNTPMLRYLSMKKAFLRKYMDQNIWKGGFGSQEHVIALAGLLDYFQQTCDFADQFPQLNQDVVSDNKNLVLQNVLPLPPKLYEQLLLQLAAVRQCHHGQDCQLP